MLNTVHRPKYGFYFIACFFMVFAGFSAHWACTIDKKAPEQAFYYWRSEVQLTQAEEAYLSGLQVERLYVKYFDVDWSEKEGAVPVSTVQWGQGNWRKFEIVPVVFLTNRIWTLGANPYDLAQKILQRTYDLHPDGMLLKEVQIDCDWTNNTRDAYFAFLETLRVALTTEGFQLSVTLRLHQFADPAGTGIPPVDRVMLMCYNTGDVSDSRTNNSILEETDIAPYLKSSEAYPIPLDVVLPLFRWTAVYRDGKLAHLIHGLDDPALVDTAHFNIDPGHRYIAKNDTYVDGYLLYAGDTLRTEAVTKDKLASVWRMIQPRTAPVQRLAWYHLSPEAVKQYPAVELLEIAGSK